MFNCSESEALGLPITHFIPFRFRGQHYDHVSQFEKEQGSALSHKKTFPMVGKRLNGDEFPSEASISLVLLNLISDILDLSKVEAGHMVLDLQPLNLADLIKEVHNVFLIKIREKGITIEIVIRDNLPESIVTDEKFLRQILFNLVGNAVKFTHTGKVDIIIENVPKEKPGSRIDLLFSVVETGIGIPASELSSIFEPFIQVKHQSKTKYGGTGLGLSITKRLTELLSGTISVVSEHGAGSTFRVLLNDIEISAISLGNTSHIDKNYLKNIRFKNPLVLIVEDIPSNRQVIKGYLETYNIRIAENRKWRRVHGHGSSNKARFNLDGHANACN